MTKYVTKNDRNGRARYYKSEDGRLKAVSRAEYEANVNAEVEAEVMVKPEEAALGVVRNIVAGMAGCDEGKVKLQTTRSSVLINYRNCMVCALDFDENHAVAAIRFMGVSLESRKQATVCEVKSLSEYADRIAEQVVFINWWWANSSRKKAA